MWLWALQGRYKLAHSKRTPYYLKYFEKVERVARTFTWTRAFPKNTEALTTYTLIPAKYLLGWHIKWDKVSNLRKFNLQQDHLADWELGSWGLQLLLVVVSYAKEVHRVVDLTTTFLNLTAVITMPIPLGKMMHIIWSFLKNQLH